MKRFLTLLAAATALTAAPAAAQTVAIVNGKVAIGDGSGPVDNGTVVIRTAASSPPAPASPSRATPSASTPRAAGSRRASSPAGPISA